MSVNPGFPEGAVIVPQAWSDMMFAEVHRAYRDATKAPVDENAVSLAQMTASVDMALEKSMEGDAEGAESHLVEALRKGLFCMASNGFPCQSLFQIMGFALCELHKAKMAEATQKKVPIIQVMSGYLLFAQAFLSEDKASESLAFFMSSLIAVVCIGVEVSPREGQAHG